MPKNSAPLLTTTKEVLAVFMKLAPLCKEDPDCWFAQAEAQFGIREIVANDTQFWVVCASSDTEVSSCVNRAE